MASKSQPNTRQIGTRASNKTTHPGRFEKPKAPRRTSAEVQEEREAKAKAKADREEAKRKSITNVAEFEHADMANEDLLDATPRPLFTPKPWPRSKSKKRSRVDPPAEPNEVEIDDDNLAFDNTPLTPVAEDLETEHEDDAENKSLTDDKSDSIEYTSPPTKKQKTIPPIKKQKGKKVDRGEKAMVATDDEETQETPKPKKTKAKVREEIDFAAKKMKEVQAKLEINKYADMLKSHKPSSQLEAVGGSGSQRKLKREGAIADISAMYKKVTVATADQNVSTGNNNNDVMDIDKR